MTRCETLQNKPTRKQRKRIALENIKQLRNMIHFCLGMLPFHAEYSAQEILSSVSDAVISWEELGTTPGKLKELVLQNKLLYYPLALKELRRAANYPYHARASATAIRKGVHCGEISWEKLGITEREFNELMRTYEDRFKRFPL
ncbi:MAG: hypothetical protein HYT61_01440 [Candidatus Yanofskybacteria bacterium]|nr:hypothetical protein [Candidatus Yanofskybacteria bacterium]